MGEPELPVAETASQASRYGRVVIGRVRPLVEILYFEGCPNHGPARELVERVSGELGVEPQIALTQVRDPEAAERLRFLGSPTVRIDGVDVEPGAERRADFSLACRVYATRTGPAGVPDETWVRAAIRGGAQR